MRRKRVLLLAYRFPPDPAPGTWRAAALARYLPQFGWEATVITRHPGDGSVDARIEAVEDVGVAMQNSIRSQFVRAGASERSPLRAALRAAKEAVMIPDRFAMWVPKAVVRGLQVAREQPHHAIIGTMPPLSVIVASTILGARTGLPWIADYRDPWTGNPYSHNGPTRRALEAVLERRLLATAAAVTTISPSIAENLRKLSMRSDARVLPHAYDLDGRGDENVTPTRFDLCYTGSMYHGTRTPDLLFEALRRLKAENHPAVAGVHVDFYGPDSANVDVSAQRHDVEAMVTRHGQVPRADALRAQRSAAVLLVFLNMDPATSGELGSKYLEYLAAGRPMLVLGPPNSVLRDIVVRNRLGWFASNAEETKAALQAAYARYATGDVELHVDPNAFLSTLDLAGRFAELLDEVVAYRKTA